MNKMDNYTEFIYYIILKFYVINIFIKYHINHNVKIISFVF